MLRSEAGLQIYIALASKFVKKRDKRGSLFRKKEVACNFMDTAKMIEEFIIKAAPVEWWEYAQELKTASEVLSGMNDNSFIATYHSDTEEIVKRPGVSRTYMLTIGICLENLLKGLLIAENPDYVKDG
ncbi:MAG: hypothetical protein MUF24_09790, partial [Chitinophagaceae bacterium]|nr:hypothetical protein [Chitinophagaceae bacterium]